MLVTFSLLKQSSMFVTARSEEASTMRSLDVDGGNITSTVVDTFRKNQMNETERKRDDMINNVNISDETYPNETEKDGTTGETNVTESVGIITDKFLADFEIFTLCIMSVLFLVGIPCCVFNVLVFCYMPKNRSFVYLVMLEVSDIIHLVSSIILKIAQIIPASNGSSALTQWMVRYTSYMMMTTTRKVVVMLHLIITLDRYLAISRPFNVRGKKFLISGLICLLLYLVIYGMASPTLLRFEQASTTNQQTNKTMYYLKTTDIFKKYEAIVDSISTTTKALFVYIPLMVMTMVNVLLSVTLQRAMENRKKIVSENQAHMSSKSSEAQINKAIILFTVAFVFLSLPTNVVNEAANASTVFNLYSREKNLYRVCFNIGMCFDMVGGAIGFVFYYCKTKVFKETFVRLVLDKGRGQK